MWLDFGSFACGLGYLLLMLILLLGEWVRELLCGCVAACGFCWFVVCGLGV